MFDSVTYIKNCDPFVFGPLLAMDNSIGLSCFSWKPSSVKVNIFQKIMQFISHLIIGRNLHAHIASVTWTSYMLNWVCLKYKMTKWWSDTTVSLNITDSSQWLVLRVHPHRHSYPTLTLMLVPFHHFVISCF